MTEGQFALMVTITACVIFLLKRLEMNTEIPSIMDLARVIRAEGLTFVKFFKDIYPHKWQYATGGLTVIYTRNANQKKCEENVHIHYKKMGIRYAVRFVGEELQELKINGGPVEPDAQDVFYAKIILGEIQRSEAVRD